MDVQITSPLYPIRTLVIVLTLVFAVEGAIMLALPMFFPSGLPSIQETLIDASSLTLLITPAMWWLVVKPLKKLHEMRGQLLVQTLAAQEHEQSRIAHDLHDGLGQQLTAILIGLRVVEESSTLEEAREEARNLRQAGSDVHEDLRRLVRGLRPAVLDELGLQPALDRFLSDVARSSDTQVTWNLACPPGVRFSPAIETALFRITQEATANALRHAQPANLRVELFCNNETVSLVIDDDGSGFNPQATMEGRGARQPFGLLSIRERVSMLEGVCNLHSEIGRGTRIEVNVPLTQPVSS